MNKTVANQLRKISGEMNGVQYMILNTNSQTARKVVEWSFRCSGDYDIRKNLAEACRGRGGDDSLKNAMPKTRRNSNHKQKTSFMKKGICSRI